jgi:hypothetical protein
MAKPAGCKHWVQDGPPLPKTVGFCDLLGTPYASGSKILSVKDYNFNHANLLMVSIKVKATQPWRLDFRFEAHASMHSSGEWMSLTVVR